MTVITQEVARKVLEVVDAGLVNGVGEPKPGFMCVEAAVCYALGLPHGDDPQCVSRAVRSLKIRINDQRWSSKGARAKGLRRLAVAQLGSRDAIDDKDFAKRVAELAIRKSVPRALRAAASIQKSAEHRDKLLSAANRCEAEGTKAAAYAANSAVNAAVNAAYSAANSAVNAAYSAANSAVYSANSAVNAAVNAAAYAAADAANSAVYSAVNAAVNAAAYAANSAADAAAYAASYAANSAAYAAAYAAAYVAARDKSLADFAEDVVGILIEMKAPGCEFLALTESAA